MTGYAPNPSPDPSQSGPLLVDGDTIGPFASNGQNWAFLVVGTSGDYAISIDTAPTPGTGAQPMFVVINPDLQTQPPGAQGAQQSYARVTLTAGTKYNLLFQIQDTTPTYFQTLHLTYLGDPPTADPTTGASDVIDGAVDVASLTSALSPAALAAATMLAPAAGVAPLHLGQRTRAGWESQLAYSSYPVWQRIDLPARAGGWTLLACHDPSAHGMAAPPTQIDTVMWLVTVAGEATAAALAAGTSTATQIAYGDDVHGSFAEVSATIASSAATTVFIGSATYGTGPNSYDLAVYVQATPASDPPPVDPVDVEPVPLDPPAVVVTRALRRVTPVLGERPALVNGRPGSPWHVLSTDDADVGVPHLFVAGQDVTWWRDVPVAIDSLTDAEPFGDGGAQFTFSGITALDTPGQGDLAWLREGVDAEVWLYRPDGTRDEDPWWAGFIVSTEPVISATETSVVVQAAGALFQADQQRHRVPLSLPATDVGDVISGALNAVVGRRFKTVPAQLTGIQTTQRGATSTVLSYVQELLATATTSAGAQWTVKRNPGQLRGYRVAPKDRSGVTATLVVGQPGLVIQTLVRDVTTAPNVLYGSGTGPDGYAWAGWAYPNLRADDAPAYPNSNPSKVITVGTRDADTDSRLGVTVWQQRMVDLGYRLTIDGTFSAADRDALKAIQTAGGITRDGVLGPQSWALTFDVGSNAGSLDGALRLPLAFDPRVEPLRYAPTGAVLGANPDYDPSVLRVESDTAYGAGITKADAVRSATAELARLGTAGWVGTLVLTLDPPELSRFLLRGGDNVLLKGWAGGDLLLHVAGRTITGLDSVSLTVDSQARDLLTVAALIARDAETSADIARRPGKLMRTSQLDRDVVVAFDGESGAGRIPRVAVFAGLWTVLRIPVSQSGRIARLELTATNPVTRFSLALFGAPITAAQLVSLVGDPLNEPEDGDLRPYVRNLDALEEAGFIEAFGTGEAGAGYYPGNPGDDNPITGRLVETAAIEYVSANPPWLWVALYSPTSCFMQGRLYPAPQVV